MAVEAASEALRSLVAVAIVYIVLDTMFVILRFVSRLFVKRSELGWDDYLIVPAYLFNIAACVLGLLIAHYEASDRPSNLPILDPDRLFRILKCVYALILVLIPGFTLPKLSILTLYLRIFTGPRTRFVTWIIFAATVFVGIAYEISTIIMCRPIRAFWTVAIQQESQCIDFRFFYRSFALPNIILDVMILVVPVPAVWSLQVSTARKAGLTVMFFTFVITLVATCVRWAVYTHYDPTSVEPASNSLLIYINIIESSTALIASCIPAMYPVLSLLTPHWVRARVANHLPGPLRRRASTTTPLNVAHMSQGNKTNAGLGGISAGVRTSLTQRARPTEGDTKQWKQANAASFARLAEPPDETKVGGAEHVIYPDGSVAGANGAGRAGHLDPMIGSEQLGLPIDGSGQLGSASRSFEQERGVNAGRGGTQAKAVRLLGEDPQGLSSGRGADGGGAMAMEDLRRLGIAGGADGALGSGGDGHGIAVRTDITVTTEERIEKLVGI